MPAGIASLAFVGGHSALLFVGPARHRRGPRYSPFAQGLPLSPVMGERQRSNP